MFGILVYDILFFTIPILLFAFLGISIYRFVSAKKKNAAEPGTFSQSEMTSRKVLMIVASVLAGVFLVIVLGFVVLTFMAVAFM